MQSSLVVEPFDEVEDRHARLPARPEPHSVDELRLEGGHCCVPDFSGKGGGLWAGSEWTNGVEREPLTVGRQECRADPSPRSRDDLCQVFWSLTLSLFSSGVGELGGDGWLNCGNPIDPPDFLSDATEAPRVGNALLIACGCGLRP